MPGGARFPLSTQYSSANLAIPFRPFFTGSPYLRTQAVPIIHVLLKDVRQQHVFDEQALFNPDRTPLSIAEFNYLRQETAHELSM